MNECEDSKNNKDNNSRAQSNLRGQKSCENSKNKTQIFESKC